MAIFRSADAFCLFFIHFLSSLWPSELSASGFIGPFGAFITGIVAGLVCFGAVQIIKPMFKLDDRNGLGQLLWTQIVAVGATAVWAGVGSFVILKIVASTVGLRVSQDDEIEGLDITTHGERGYEI